MALRIELAGRLRVGAGGGAAEAASFPGRQARLAFAFLVLRRRPVDRGELAEAVWAGRLPRSWERDLSAVVSKLRALLNRLGTGASIEGGHSYELRLPPDATVDVDEARAALDRAEAALDRGDPAAAAAAADGAVATARRGLLPGLEAPWLDEARDGLRAVLVRGLDVRAAAAAAEGRAAAALADASEAVALEPFRETGHAALVRLHLTAGDRAAALRAYERCRTLLVEELGVGPGPETEAAYQEALRADLGPDTAPAIRLLGAGSTPFVGREHEVHALRALLDAAGSGVRTAVVTGEAGVGKSRLAAEVSHAVADRALVLVGRCDREAAVPYGPFVEALQPLRAVAGLDAALAPVRALFPDGRDASPPDADPRLGRHRLFEAVLDVLEAAARDRPVVLVLDDLQWCDSSTALLLRHVGRTARPLAVLVLALCRSGRPGGPALPAALDDLDHDGRLERLEVRGLATGEVAALLEAAGAPEAHGLAPAVRAVTQGNPWFVRELARHLVERGAPVPPDAAASGHDLIRAVGVPRALGEVVGTTLARLSPAALGVVRATAVAGSDVDLEVLGSACGLASDSLVPAVDEAVAAGALVRVDSGAGGVRFAHALVAEVAYAELPPPERAGLHRRVADALEAVHAPALDAHLGALSRHLALAAAPGRLGRSVEYAERAGDRALASLADEEAAHHYRRALDLVQLGGAGAGATRCRLLLALGDASNRAGRVEDARSALEEAVALARAERLPARLVEAVLAWSALLLDEGVEGGATSSRLVALLEEGLAATPPGPSPGRARLLARLSVELHFAEGALARREDLADEAEAMARRLDDPAALAEALTARSYALLGSPEADRRGVVADELVALSATTGRSSSLLWRVRHALEVGSVEVADDAVRRLAADAEARGVGAGWFPQVWGALRALLTGPLEPVERLAEEAAALGRGRGPDAVLAVLGAQLFGLRLLQGRLDELVPAVAAAAEASPQRPVWAAALALARAEAGDLDGARRDLRRLVAGGVARQPRTVDRPVTLTLLAWTCGHVGDRDAAEELYELVRPHAPLFVVVGVNPALCAGSFHHPLGVAAAVAGRRREADAHLRAAVECAEGIGAAPWADLARRDAERVLT